MNIKSIKNGWLLCLYLLLPGQSASALEFEKRVFFANPASNITQQTFVRFINTNSNTVSVEVMGIDDNGQNAPGGILSFNLLASESLQLNAQDLENGNPGKGTSGAMGNGAGKWQLKVGSTAPIEVMSLIRTPDGFVTSLTDVVPISGGINEVFFANPASNQTQQSFLRVVNRTQDTGLITITAVDDNGTPAPGGDITFTLGPNAAKQFNSLDYENGNAGKGLTGSLGNGIGKWHLSFSSPLDLEVMSLIRTPDGFLTNLSGVTPTNSAGDNQIYIANPASNTDQQTFIRVVNTSNTAGTVTISGKDDEGAIAPNGDIQFDLGAFEAKQLNAADLENGNLAKGVTGSLGDGNGRWQLDVSANIAVTVMNMIRTADGFVTNMSRVAQKTANQARDVFIVNPGSNPNQRSSLRIVNTSQQSGSFTITGVDDSGENAPSGSITFNLDASATREISAIALEDGVIADGLAGVLGNGTGKWRLAISADVSFEVLSLLDTPTGFLTNLSRVTPTVLLVDSTSPATGAQLNSSPAQVSVSLNQLADPTSINSATITLTGSGGDGTFSDGNEDAISPATIALNNADASVAEIDLSNVTLADDTYQIKMIGTGNTAVTNQDGLPLDGDADGATGGDFTSEFSVVSVSANAKLSFIQANVFTPSCATAGCHSAATQRAGLNLSTGFAFSNIVNTTSTQQGALMRVKPGDPDASYLIRKLEGGPAISGSKMPVGPALSQSVIDNIREWISNGAANN